MKHKITLFALLGTTLGFSQDYSGRVGINTETPNTTLEVKGSPNDTEVIDGFIPPKITFTQITAKTNYNHHQTGALIYITDTTNSEGIYNHQNQFIRTQGYYYWNGTTWRPLKGKDGELVRIETNTNRYGWGLPYRLNNPHNYDTIGEYAVDFSLSQVPTSRTGEQYGATGKASFAIGTHTIASGGYSFAHGERAFATGGYSYATDVVDNKKKKNNYDFSENRYKELVDKCQKVFMLLAQFHCEPQFLKEEDWEQYIGDILAMNIADIPTFDNIKSFNSHLRFGDRYGKVISFVDVENIELPSQIEPYSLLGGNGTASETAVDNFSFINELEDYHMIVYNQIISIPEQAPKQRELDKKKKKHEGVSKSAPSNEIIAEEIETLLHNIAVDGQLIVDAHFSIVFACDSQEKMEKTQSMIESKLFTKGIIVSKNAYNQLELYRCVIPGNAVELKDYDLFTTTSEASLCFF